MKNEEIDYTGEVINNKYRIIKRIGRGSFFNVYQAEYLGDFFAVKFEKSGKSTRIKNISEILLNTVGPSIPYIKEISIFNKENYIVTQLMGPSLKKKFMNLDKFSIKTTAMIGYQILHILEVVHNEGIVHRNLGRDNFVLGFDDLRNKIFLIDFSLAQRYKNDKGELIPMKENVPFSGIQRNASINALKGLTQCRRDDLESLGYILVEFLKGDLPWGGRKGMSKDEKLELASIKENISAQKLCEGLPEQLEKYIEYCRNLKYEEDPDYEMLKKLMTDMISKNNQVFDYIYDWSDSKDKNDNKYCNFEEIDDLKSKLMEKDKIINKLNEQNKKLGNTNAFEMLETIEKLQKELGALKEATKISSNNVVSLHFVSPDSSINFCFTCKLTDKFADVERKLIEKFPKLEEFNCNYLVNGKNVKRYKNLLENSIHEDGSKIIVIYNDESC